MAESIDHPPDELFDRALDAIETETQRTTTERDALEAFDTQVRDLSVTRPTTETSPRSIRAASNRERLGTVREQYESTVMAVPHYEEEYDECFAKHIHEEFGPDVATVLVYGSGFQRRHKRAILAATTDSIAVREQLLEALQAERESITSLREPVCSVSTDINRLETAAGEEGSRQLLDGYRSRLDVLERRCHELIERRQSEMVSERRELTLPRHGPDIPTYVYHDLPVTYPVVGILTDLIGSATALKARVETVLAERSRA